jgi:L-lactate dehydrogenase complex protein LldF
MQNNANNFVALADISINNPHLQKAVKAGTFNAHSHRLDALYREGHEHGEILRQQAAEAKRRVLRDLPDLLEQAEVNLEANGIKVLWAVDAEEANQHVLNISREHHIKRVTKSKSMVSEELAINQVLQDEGIRVVETDLGEYIVQLSDSRPGHIIAPVLHKTKEEIRDLFIDKLGMPPTDEAVEMVAFARQKLRQEFLDADMGISGANFIIAETGSIGLVMNEGNGRMVTSMPKVHIALVGIERLVATVEDYALLNQMLVRSGTGQNLTVYTNIINGPSRTEEADGPEHVYVIFLDNGRSRIYASEYTEVLSCIRCGACQNACPVYRSISGEPYGWVYGGPIGAVLTPLLKGLENAAPLPYASSLCSACKQACPVDIDLPRMLLELRHDMVEQGIGTQNWKLGMKAWAFANTSAMRFEMSGKMARLGQKVAGNRLPGVLGDWQKYRDFPEFAEKPFRELWRETVKSETSP